MQKKKDPNKLTSIDEHGGHLNIIPAEVRGYFRRRRNLVHFLLLCIFLVTPWIRIHGKQLILLNIRDREFTLLGLIFRSHDAPLIFLLLAIGTLGLAFVTAIWGRVWCGWACPQTVFIEAVYRRIEILVEGSYLERRKLQIEPWTFSKVRKKIAKWILILGVSVLISHSFAAYFIGSYELLKMMGSSPIENWDYFLTIAFLTALITFDFAWFREQFCVIMCPYGRIQSVLLEPSSLAVVYDAQRGEPRKGLNLESKTRGDCVNCNRCVEVCPTGIDIRNGLQMECISCTACIDACDEIMAKVNKPLGLISYKTLDGSKIQILKLKTALYGILILVSTCALAYNLGSREPVEIAVLRAIESPYTKEIGDNGQEQIINHFRIHLVSQIERDASYSVELSDAASKRGMTLTVAQNPILIKSKGSETWHLFVRIPRAQLGPSGKIEFKILIKSEADFTATREVVFLGPKT